jgi:hypothetical protein
VPDKPETATDVSWFIPRNGYGPRALLRGPAGCNELTGGSYIADSGVTPPTGYTPNLLLIYGPSNGVQLSGEAASVSDSVTNYPLGGADDFIWNMPGWTGYFLDENDEVTQGGVNVIRTHTLRAWWRIICTNDETLGARVVVLAELERTDRLLAVPFLENVDNPNPPVRFLFDGEHEDEEPVLLRRRRRQITAVIASECGPTDDATAACSGSAAKVIQWRPTELAVTIRDNGILVNDESIDWQTDELLENTAGWREYTPTTGPITRAPASGEPYFASLPFTPITWKAAFIYLPPGDVWVETAYQLCGLSVLATEDVIDVPNGTPLPLGDEQAAYVHGYATAATASQPCPLSSYPSWSIYWKKKHVLVTDLEVTRCGTIPAAVTFTVWLYFDGLINDTLTGNEINGVPINGFAMAVRSWTVTIRGNQPPTVTLNGGGYSPCSTTGALPFCNDAVPQFAAIHGQ